MFLTTGSSKLSNIQLVLSFSKGEAGSDEALFRTIVDRGGVGVYTCGIFCGCEKKERKMPMSNALGT